MLTGALVLGYRQVTERPAVGKTTNAQTNSASWRYAEQSVTCGLIKTNVLSTFYQNHCSYWCVLCAVGLARTKGEHLNKDLVV